jgi:hypothetical protein
VRATRPPEVVVSELLAPIVVLLPPLVVPPLEPLAPLALVSVLGLLPEPVVVLPLPLVPLLPAAVLPELVLPAEPVLGPPVLAAPAPPVPEPVAPDPLVPGDADEPEPVVPEPLLLPDVCASDSPPMAKAAAAARVVRVFLVVIMSYSLSGNPEGNRLNEASAKPAGSETTFPSGESKVGFCRHSL